MGKHAGEVNMISDTIADMLARIRNVSLLGRKKVTVRPSKFSKNVLSVLKKEGFINGYEDVESGILVHLKYYDGYPVIRGMRKVSKPSVRIYYKAKDLKHIRKKRFGIMVVSSSMGVLSDIECRRRNIGGEAVCEVY